MISATRRSYAVRQVTPLKLYVPLSLGSLASSAPTGFPSNSSTAGWSTIFVIVEPWPTAAPLLELEAAETCSLLTSITVGSTPRSLMRRNFPVSSLTRNGAHVCSLRNGLFSSSSLTITYIIDNASAASVAGCIGTHLSALAANCVKTGSITTSFVPDS